jgi:eukaryotic-like serine/threonine-protein kinase
LNLWNYDVRTGSRNRITSGYGEDYSVWSPDGNRIVYALFIDNQWILSLRNVAGTGDEEQLQNLSGRPRPYDWSPDGNYLLIGIINPINMVEDLWIYPLTGEKKPIPFLNSEFQETEGRISPDGRWVAFSSDQSGEFEIYLKLLSGNNSQTWKISTQGGWLPRWGANANEIFFVDSNNKLNLATLQYRNNELEITELQSLFTAPIFLGDYDVSPDGETIVVNKYLEYQDFPPLSIIMNWNTGLQ